MKVWCDRYHSPGLADWNFYCEVHDESVWCDNWHDAMEAAWGHACMKHPKSAHTKGCRKWMGAAPGQRKCVCPFGNPG